MENRLKTSGFRPSNSFYPSNTGLITTLAQGGEQQDIRKSRIQHLPSYRKGDLSDKLQFVVVFQTIEIQRLSIEIQSLRVKLKDSDRQIRIYLNYQVQIKELTQNCHQLQQQRAYYQNQIEQLSLSCNQLYQQLTKNKKENDREIQGLKKQFYTTQAQLQRENQSLQQQNQKLQTEILKNNQKQKEAETKIKSLFQQLLKANQNCRENQNQIALFKEIQLKKTQQLRKAQADIRNLQTNYNQQKLQRQTMQKQIEQQQRDQQKVITELIEQNKKLGNQIDKKKAQIITITNNREKDNKLLDNNKKQLEGSKKQNQNIKNQLQQFQNQYKQKAKDANLLQRANEQLRNQIKNVTIDLSKNKDKYEQMNDFANELKKRIQTKSKQVQGFKKYLFDFQQQYQNMLKRQAELNKKITALEPVYTQNNLLQQKIYQLNSKLSEKELQVNGKQKLIFDLTIQNKELVHIRKQLQAKCLRNQNEGKQLEEKIRLQRQSNERQKKQFANEFQQKIDKLSQQKKSLNSQKNKLENDIDKLRSDGVIKEDMKLQIKRLNDNCKRQEKDIQTINTRFPIIYKLIKNLREKHEQFNEIEKANSLLKKQLESSFNLIDKMIQKIGTYEQQIENLTDQNWRLTDKLKQEYYKDEYFSTSSSTKTIESQYNSTPALINSARFSSFQNKPLEPFGFGISTNVAPSVNLSVSNVREFPTLSTDLNAFRTRDAESKRILQNSSLYPSRQSNVYTSMIGQYSSRGGFEFQNNQNRR